MRLAMFVTCVAMLAAAPLAQAGPKPGSYAAAAAAEAKPLPPAQRFERRFLQITAANLRFQSEASRLALARSGHPAVKDLASTLLAHQQAVQPELLRLLQARDMALPIPGNVHGKMLKQLARLNGAKFDRLYVDEVLQSLGEDTANHEKAAAQAEDPVLRAWAERQLPALRFHGAKAGRALPAAAPRAHRAR